MQGAGAQFNVSGPGFLPDKNGTNPDDPNGGNIASKVAARTVFKDCAECPEMVVIPAGSFVMGSEKSANEKPIHSVAIRSFLLGKNEVTQKQWLDVMGSNPSRFEDCGLQCPVESVNWNEVQAFIRKLNQQTGRSYRLPSESEWEYAARAGTTTEWSFGNDESELPNYGWYNLNSGVTTSPVRQKNSNDFGLYDTLGNVWEWVEDCWHENYLGGPLGGEPWISGCTASYRVARGGSWSTFGSGLRAARRISLTPDNRGGGAVGFRLARDL